MVGDHAGEAFAPDEVADRLRLRLGESARADVGLVARHVAGGGHVENAPHVAVVAVRVDAERAVVVPPAVLAPEPRFRPAVLVAVRVDHRGDPDFSAGEPAGDRRLVGPLDELLREQEGHLHGDPLARVVAAHEEKLGNATAAVPDPQGQDGPALDAAADLDQLGDVRPRFRELPQLLLQAGCRMILLRRLGPGEGGQVPCHILELLDAVTHAGQAVQLSLGSTKDQVVRLDLPDVDAERHPENIAKSLLRSRRPDPGDEIHATFPSFGKASPIRDPPVADEASGAPRSPGRRSCGGVPPRLCVGARAR